MMATMRAITVAILTLASACGLFGDSASDGPYVEGDWRIERFAKAEVARMMSQGMAAIAADVRTLLTDPDPTAQAMLTESVGTSNLANAVQLLDAMSELTQMIEADYMAIPDEDEPAVQAILD